MSVFCTFSYPLRPQKFKPVLLEICTHDTSLVYSIVSVLNWYLHRKNVLFYLTCRLAWQTVCLVTQHYKQKSTGDQPKQTVKLTVNYFIQVFVNSSLVREASKIPLWCGSLTASLLLFANYAPSEDQLEEPYSLFRATSEPRIGCYLRAK